MHFITSEEHGKISLVKDRSVCLHEGGVCWSERQRRKERLVNRERSWMREEEKRKVWRGELIRSAVWGVCDDGGWWWWWCS